MSDEHLRGVRDAADPVDVTTGSTYLSSRMGRVLAERAAAGVTPAEHDAFYALDAAAKRGGWERLGQPHEHDRVYARGRKQVRVYSTDGKVTRMSGVYEGTVLESRGPGRGQQSEAALAWLEDRR